MRRPDEAEPFLQRDRGRRSGGGSCGGLAELNLSVNKIGEGGAAAVAAALGGGSCGGLRGLYISCNEIGEGGAAALQAALLSGACGSLTKLGLNANEIGTETQQAVIVALGDLPKAVQRRTARWTVAALQRLALARVAVGAGSARWSTGGPVAAAIAALSYVASRTVGAPNHSMLEVLHLLAGLPEAAAAVVVRHATQHSATQPAQHLAHELPRDRATAAAAAAAATAGIAGCTDDASDASDASDADLEERRRAVADRHGGCALSPSHC